MEKYSILKKPTNIDISKWIRSNENPGLSQEETRLAVKK